ncbi:MAG: hypothetical protein LBF80_07345 [Spirochaetaceae bacterium]|jgi:hypothetical protein|nr:hypothetical protein [Spirochaetaceae bacterium]
MKKSIVSGVLIIAAVLCLLLICWFAVQFGAIDPSEMPGSFIGAALGAAITGVITVILLKGQSSAEEKKERAVKIFEEKLVVYSRFMEHLWGMFSDTEVTREELTHLRNICFQQLVFFLDDEQIKSITKQLETVAGDIDKGIAAASQITFILKDSLNLVAVKSPKETEGPKRNLLTDLFKSFEYKDTFTESKTGATPSLELDSSQQSFENQDVLPAYWHFAMYDERQIKVLEDDNNKEKTLLSLFEIGASWRTEYVRQVKPGDVVFLFKRGGDGYIGAFKAIGNRVLEWEEYEKDPDNYDCDERYDMYKCFDDGTADYAANIIVRPLAFNYKGVGCKSPRRKTI